MRRQIEGLKQTAIALIIAVLTQFPVLAQNSAFSSLQLEALKAQTQTFETAITEHDMRTVLGFMPPQVKQSILQKAQITEEQLVEGLSLAMKQTFEETELISAKMDIEASEQAVLADGMGYLLIPTKTTLEIENYGPMQISSKTLAFLENGQWYLMRISDTPQKEMLVEAYPAFKDVELPGEVIEEKHNSRN